jgi:predicted N-formylglutamate amidohydrolase
MTLSALLEAGSDKPFVSVEGDPAGGILLLCDHASNAIPAEYDDLGLSPPDLLRHIAYDPGAAPVTLGLAEYLAVPAVLSTWSRLLIDANRGEDDPTLVMRLSDGVVVPGNRTVGSAERARRIARFHAPYHAAVTAAIERAKSSGRPPVLISVHSFTPVWRGRLRPWHAGVLSDGDRRAADPLITGLRADAGLMVGDNEPYAGGLPGDTMARHGTARGLAHALIEIRQDLIADDTGVAGWVDRLAPILATVNQRPQVHEVQGRAVHSF